MDNTKAFTRLKEIIDRSQRFFLISHVYTDGDALGSIIAMYHYLTLLGKEVVATVPGKIPAKYTFLGHQEIINIRSAEATKQFIQSADVILILDISSLKRMDVWYDPVMQSKASKICIDHHPGGCSGVDFQIIDDRRIATTEILYQYFKTNQIPITRPMGLALYTGILSDSGSFRFEGTSAFTLQMAGELAQLGIDPSEIFRYIFENSTKKQLKFWGHILTRLQSNGPVNWAIVPQQMLKDFDVTIEELNGLIDIIRRDATANVFIIFAENEKNEIMVGLRSRNGFNVGEIARHFGGGGHLHAAGFSSTNSMESVVTETLQMIEERIQNKGEI